VRVLGRGPFESPLGGADAAWLPASAKATAGSPKGCEGGRFDVLACSRCPGRLALVALIQAPAVINRILAHLGLPTTVPTMRPAREPPLPLEDDAPYTCTEN
jgi:hypothetical protein